MTAQTGRTVNKYIEFHLDDSGGTLRKVTGVTTVNGVGLTYDEMDVTALLDAIKNVLPNHPDLTITVGMKFDTTADTGAHHVFSGVNGLTTPLSMDIRFGMRHAWEDGEPQFGITSSATSGMIVTSYVTDPNGVDATATLRVMGGTAPAWGTTAES